MNEENFEPIEISEADKKLIENWELKVYGRILTEEEREEDMRDFNRRRIEDIKKAARREQAVIMIIIIACSGLLIGTLILALLRIL